jgi:hypothetical protein
VSATGGISTNYSYQWYSNTSNSNTGGTIISGATTSSYTPNISAVGTLYYYCVVSINPSATGCSTTSAVAAITVSAGPSINSQPQSQTICVGGTLTPLTTSHIGGTGTPTYQWYSNTSNSNTGGTIISGATTSSYTLPAALNASAGVHYYYCVLSFGSTSGCSSISTSAATITVVPDPTVTAPVSETICTGGSPSALSVTASGGISTSYSYQWYSTTSGLIAG